MSGALLALGIAVAGGVGAALRFLVDGSIPARVRSRFPLGIMVVNLSGSFALGLLAGLVFEVPVLSVLTVGLLGGYTTLSTASVDSVRLLQQRRYLAALANSIGMLIVATGCATLGIILARLAT